MSNKLTQMALELLQIEKDLPFRFDYNKKHRPTLDDFELHIFEQTWGSTALGFGGMGGQAITNAMTYVFTPINVDQNCFVYFAGHFAYSVPCSRIFMEDVANERMESVSRAGKYRMED